MTALGSILRAGSEELRRSGVARAEVFAATKLPCFAVSMAKVSTEGATR